ncbi:Rieske (2Fe-2S) protein [Streptomyces sp. NPDC086023]|uniref:Rieske (2Fe-2S) protein n=1 Tax=Streptomyces sp. NPDC086023 TaxID=3365746 RepID=UPI0037D408A1
MSAQPAARRTVLKGAAALAGAAAAGISLAACSTEAGSTVDAEKPSEPLDLGGAEAVPVGGAKLFREQRLLVSQPSAGQYRAFSAKCTHAGCILDKIENGEGNCPCHMSRFDVATGKVLSGPAPSPLPEIPVKVEGGKIIAG